MKILDCTIRDGGYYTNWDFDDDIIENYCKSMEQMPIDYIEVGYRSIPLKGYLGKYFYCPLYILERLKNLMPSKKLVIILNEKDIRSSDVEELLTPIKTYISLVRIAVDPKNFDRAIGLAKAVKKLGFELAFNVMYMSSWKDNASFLDKLVQLEGCLDFFYMVDSYGGILPNDVKEIIKLVKSKTNVPLGFHGHDNLHMGLINTITALEEGCEIVDATITGMGRGAGNLQTELLLTYLESKKEINIDFNLLSSVVSNFEKLKKNHEWGSSLAYMFSGAYSLPQKDVMEWVGMNRYSLSTIVNALNIKKETKEDNFKLPSFKPLSNSETVVLIGGGSSVLNNIEALKKYTSQNKEVTIIHAGFRNLKLFDGFNGVQQFYSLIGTENEEDLINLKADKDFKYIYSPYPRKMGTNVFDEIKNNCFELEEITFTENSNDSYFAIATQIAIKLNAKKIFLLGFDGYNLNLNKNQFLLAQENQKIIDDLLKLKEIQTSSLNPTKYKGLKLTSIYSLL